MLYIHIEVLYCLCHSVAHACLRQRHFIPGLGLSSIPVQIYICTRAPVHLYVSLSLSLWVNSSLYPVFNSNSHLLDVYLARVSREICLLMILKYSLKVCSVLFLNLAIQDYPSNFTAEWIHSESKRRPPSPAIARPRLHAWTAWMKTVAIQH